MHYKGPRHNCTTLVQPLQAPHRQCPLCGRPDELKSNTGELAPCGCEYTPASNSGSSRGVHAGWLCSLLYGYLK